MESLWQTLFRGRLKVASDTYDAALDYVYGRWQSTVSEHHHHLLLIPKSTCHIVTTIISNTKKLLLLL